MSIDRLRVAVIGAGRWSNTAHLPGFARSPLCDLVCICDLERDLAADRAARFDIPDIETDAERVLARGDIDVVDVVTRGDHQDLVFATDDADMFMGEAAGGALFSLQSSYVTVGSYPGIEARIFGSQGAIRTRLVEEFGVIQTIHTATPDAVEYVERDIPAHYFPPGFRDDDPWGTAFYGNLVHDFLGEITAGGDTNQGDFAQSARVQEIINAVALSHREGRWVSLPLGDVDSSVPSSPW